MDETRFAFFCLSQLTRFSYGQIRDMMELAGSAEEAMRLTPEEIAGAGLPLTGPQALQLADCADLPKMLSLYEAMGSDTRIVTFADDDFPELLREIPEPPLWLFVRGAMPSADEPGVAVIGARRCSVYGREMAAFFGRELARQGVHVISGMASGVDGYAQRGAVEAQTGDPRAGRSFGVLGGGTDICYPRENIDLFTDLLQNGNGILSERPPGYFSRFYDFPRRNRLISGLSRAVLVIEAAEKSGTLITVGDALEQDREVFALPGRVSDRTSRGCNELLKNGAHVLTCPEDVLQFLGKKVAQDTLKSPRALLTPEEESVYACLSLTPVSVDELLGKTGLPAGVLLEILVRLEIKSVVKKSGISGYLRAL